MNDIILKELVRGDQRRYDFVTVPLEVQVAPPPRACVEVPKYDFDKQYDDFAFHSLLTREESIQGVNKVRQKIYRRKSQYTYIFRTLYR